MTTIRQALHSAYSKLTEAHIPSATLDAEVLLSFVLSKPREYILAHQDEQITTEHKQTFNKLIARRTQQVPVAYLTHEKEFYGRTFYVDERVLVPRPETEQIVEELRIRNYELGINTTIIDVGTGSGCIITTLVKELESKRLRVNGQRFIATDISQDALAVARQNANRYGVANDITFLQGNLLEPILQNNKLVISNSPLVLCVNLPYLTPEETRILPTIQYDPALALDGGGDGLDLYRELAEQIKTLRAQHPDTPISLIAEIGETHGAEMQYIFSFAQNLTIKKDLVGLDRIAVIEFKMLNLEF